MRAVNWCAVLVSFVTLPLFGGNCSWLTSPTAAAFGTYSVFSTADLATLTNLSFRCSPFQYARVTFSTGNAGVYLPSRRMSSGAATANYNLYFDAGRTQVAGDASGGSVSFDEFNSTPQVKDFSDTIFGIVPWGQDLAAGSFTDTVFVTLSYGNCSAPCTTPPVSLNSLPPVSMTVTMNVVAECRVDSFGLNFGSYDPFSATALTQSTLLKVYCTKSSAPTSIVLNTGSFPLGGQRRMSDSAGDFLVYNAALGSTSGTSTSSLVPINGGFAVNADVPAGQNVTVGSYADTLVASVNY